ncbi:MAG TPA: hypothetical protein VNX28_10530 [Gemmataceae bacterium]|jgi:hypothetical protein|nr:hypothetical protein [Gemmataceae bacterium]
MSEGDQKADLDFNRVCPPRVYVHFYQSASDSKGVSFGPFLSVMPLQHPDWRLDVTETFQDVIDRRRFTLAVYDGTRWRLCGQEEPTFEFVDFSSLPPAVQAGTPGAEHD